MKNKNTHHSQLSRFGSYAVQVNCFFKSVFCGRFRRASPFFFVVSNCMLYFYSFQFIYFVNQVFFSPSITHSKTGSKFNLCRQYWELILTQWKKFPPPIFQVCSTKNKVRVCKLAINDLAPSNFKPDSFWSKYIEREIVKKNASIYLKQSPWQVILP